MVSKLPLAGFILVTFIFLLDLCISYGTIYWYYQDQDVSGGNTKIKIGLWRHCTEVTSSGSTTENCYWLWDDNFAIDKMFEGQTQVFQSVGVFVLFITMIILFLKTFIKSCRGNQGILPVAASFTMLAAACFIASAATFAYGIHDTVNVNTSNLHFSLGAAAGCGALALITGILLIVAAVKDSKSSNSVGIKV